MNGLKNRYRYAWLVIASLLMGSTATAAVLSDLYQVDVRLQHNTHDARNIAYRDGLREVLIRLTGDSEIATKPGIDSILDDAPSYVQQFRMLPVGQVIQVTYAQEALQQALVAQGHTSWGASRPETLIWFALATETQREILGESTESSVVEELNLIATKRGLPLLFPLLDLQDQQALSYADVRGGFNGRITTASERYGISNVLVADVKQRGSGWRGDWTLRQNGGVERWSVAAASLSAVLEAGMDGLSEHLINRFVSQTPSVPSTSIPTSPAPASSAMVTSTMPTSTVSPLETIGQWAPGGTYLQVSGIKSVEDYAEVATLLRELPMVTGTSVSHIGVNTTTFTLQMNGSEASLQRALDQSPSMRVVQGDTSLPSSILQYELTSY